MNRPNSTPADHLPVIELLESRKLLAATKVMPLGDSITASFTDSASYRFWLFKQLQLSGYDVDFVGSLNKAYDFAAAQENFAPTLYTDFDPDHEGHSALRTDQLLANLPSYLAQNVPDIVLLHIGSNDMFQSRTVDETVNNIGSIIDTLRAANPNVDVLVAQIIPSFVLNENLAALNAAIPSLASKDTANSRVVIVDHFTGFDRDTELRDEIHPSLLGEQEIAARWFNALAPILPAPANPPAPIKYLTELPAVSSTNGLGPIGANLSVGGPERYDGGALELNGVTSIKGLGVHASSEIVYNIEGKYTRFHANVGVDDEVGSAGSVVFQVYVDGVLKFDSGVMTGDSATQAVDIDVAGATQLRLVVTDAGDGSENDHADWADARLTPVVSEPEPEPAPDPAQVTDSRFDYSRRTHAVRITFDTDVSASISRGDLQLRNLTRGKTIPTSAMAVSYDKKTNTATWTFPGLKQGILPDGRYRATLPAGSVATAAGGSLAHDFVFEFFFLTGDANHDGVVNRDDFLILKSNFGKKKLGFADGNFNYEGPINAADLVLLARNYGATVDGTGGQSGRGFAKLLKQLRSDLTEKKNKKNQNDDRDDDQRDERPVQKKKAKVAKKKARKHT